MDEYRLYLLLCIISMHIMIQFVSCRKTEEPQNTAGHIHNERKTYICLNLVSLICIYTILSIIIIQFNTTTVINTTTEFI